MATLACASVTWALAYAQHYELDFSTFSPSPPNGHSYMRDYYMRPWARCPPYLMGVGGAFAWIAWGGRGARRR